MSINEQQHHGDLYRVLRTIMRGFHEGVFCRDIVGDGRQDWAMRLLPFVAALSEADRLIGGACLGEDCPIHGGPNPEGEATGR